MSKTPADAVRLAKEAGVEMVDLKFMDFVGSWQHFAVPVGELSEDLFDEGLGFDGSSIRGWQPIQASDMIVRPDPDTAVVDPFVKRPTLSLICNIFDPITGEAYSRDPRNIAKKAEQYLAASGIADTAFFGPEPEFFIFDDVRFDLRENASFYSVDSVEGRWNTGRDEGPNLGYKPSYKGGYFPVAPVDAYNDLRNEMVRVMQEVGLDVECQHHEVATAGQAEIDIRFAPLLKCADNLQWLKYIVKNVALQAGKSVTFMPKPIYADNGSGMHVHVSLWKDNKPLFAGNDYAGLSETALYFVGGVLKHARSLIALTNPTINSFRRLVPGYEAPVKLAYSSRNRSAAVRVPMYSSSPKAKRIEFRTPDPTCNGYLAFAAMLMAGIDGIENRIHPGKPMDKDIYNLPPEEMAEIPSAPESLEAALHSLEIDHDYLLKGDVFTEDVIKTWIEWKTQNDIEPFRLRPTPLEYSLYYDC